MRVPKISLIALISLLSFATALAAPGAAPAAQTTACPNNTCHISLPFISFSIVPQLNAPDNGFASPTLAPTLSWTPVVFGTHRIQVATDPQFLPGTTMPVSITKKISPPMPANINTTISSNLVGQTTYYWRIGAPSPAGYIYSEVRSFTTPVKNNALLPPVPTIVAPKNFSRIKGTSITLRWQIVPGAISYRIRVTDANGHSVSSDELEGSTNSLKVDGVPLGTYHWRVKAMNAYGWSSYTDDFYFTLY
jgi:hypothetical protein